MHSFIISVASNRYNTFIHCIQNRSSSGVYNMTCDSVRIEYTVSNGNSSTIHHNRRLGFFNSLVNMPLENRLIIARSFSIKYTLKIPNLTFVAIEKEMSLYPKKAYINLYSTLWRQFCQLSSKIVCFVFFFAVYVYI